MTITSQWRNWYFPRGENIWDKNRSLTAMYIYIYYMELTPVPECSQLCLDLIAIPERKSMSEVNLPCNEDRHF